MAASISPREKDKAFCKIQIPGKRELWLGNA